MVHGKWRGSFQLELDRQIYWQGPLSSRLSIARKKICCSCKHSQGFVWGAFTIVLRRATQVSRTVKRSVPHVGYSRHPGTAQSMAASKALRHLLSAIEALCWPLSSRNPIPTPKTSVIGTIVVVAQHLGLTVTCITDISKPVCQVNK